MNKRKAIDVEENTTQNKRDKKLPETESVKELRKSMNELLKAFNSPETYLIGNCFYTIYFFIYLEVCRKRHIFNKEFA